MSRPVKTGLDYFPFDVDFFQDEKIKHVSARYRHKAEAVLLRLLCKIYMNGYYLEWSRDESVLFSQELQNVSTEEVEKIIREAVKRNFFDKKLKKNFKVLSSRGIQKRYIKFCQLTKRKIEINTKYLINSEETLINSELMEEGINSELMPQRKGK